MAKIKRTQVSFKQVIDDLLNNDKPFSPVHLHRFSDIDPADLAAVRIAWPQIAVERRLSLLQDLEDLAETDTLVSFDDLARFALEDTDPHVRTVAIRLLWESEDAHLIPIFIKMMRTDPDDLVRATAASGLGLFVYLGELEDISEEKRKQLEDSLLSVYQSNDKPIVRRRALEALGYSSREEVPAFIEAAYQSSDKEWLASALFAMGRSADERWEKQVLAMLDHSEPEVRLEAIRAAGELELAEARKPLLVLLKEDEGLDFDLRSATIWSLSQIGGVGVRELFERLADKTEDEDEEFILEEALDNLSFKEGSGSFGMFDLMPTIDEEHTHIVDINEENEDEEDDEEEDYLYGTKN
jgi:HEAT repeat protein